MSYPRVERALAAMAAGKVVILVDDEGRENEGDFCLAADCTMPSDINFFVTHGRGLVCLALSAERVAALELPPMVQRNTSAFGTAFTVSIEAASGVSTGISTADRAQTIRAAIATHARPQDLARPGHVFPLRAEPHGVLVRDGQTEGSVDLARLAGRAPGAVICEILRADGAMARRPELDVLAKEHGLSLVSVAELIAYRLATEALVAPLADGTIVHREFGSLRAIAFQSQFDGLEHLLVMRGLEPFFEPAQVARGEADARVELAVGRLPRLPRSAEGRVDWTAVLVAEARALAAPRAAVVLIAEAGGQPEPLAAALAGEAPKDTERPGDRQFDAQPAGGHRGLIGREAKFARQVGLAGQILRSLPSLPLALFDEGGPMQQGLESAGLSFAGNKAAKGPTACAQTAAPMVWGGPRRDAGPRKVPRSEGWP